MNLEGVSPEKRESKLLQQAREESRRPFDLSTGPLLRAALWRIAPSEHVILLVAHRMACDEASLKVLLRQLTSRYGIARETATVVGPAPLQYSEYAARQSMVSEEHILYWKQHLAGAPSSLDLPTDRPRPPQRTFHGASRPSRLRSLC